MTQATHMPERDPPLTVVRNKEDAWLKILYAEVWKQYVHEDSLTQARTNIFQVIPVVLLAFLGAASNALPKVGCATVLGTQFQLGMSLIGAVFILVAILMFLLAADFSKVTDAGRLHVNLRHMNARAIERLAGVGVLGPALLEHHMRDFKPADPPNDRYRPYSDIAELQGYPDLSTAAYSRFGGFAYLAHITKLWRIVFAIVLAIGVVLLVGGLVSPSLSLERFLPGLAC